MYRSWFKIRAEHINFSTKSMYNQLEHEMIVCLFHITTVRVVADYYFTMAISSTVEHFSTSEQIFVNLIVMTIDRAQITSLK